MARRWVDLGLRHQAFVTLGLEAVYPFSIQTQVASVESAGYEEVASGYGLALLRKR